MENGIFAEILRNIHSKLEDIDLKLDSKAGASNLNALEQRVRNTESELTKHKTIGTVAAFLLGFLGIKF